MILNHIPKSFNLNDKLKLFAKPYRASLLNPMVLIYFPF